MEKLSPNSLAFLALGNEFCQRLEQAMTTTHDEFVTAMAKLLPRLYMMALDLPQAMVVTEAEIAPHLDEEQYNSVRADVSRVLAEDDVYLEVFMDDMKYSDTPIATSISENLADLYQEFFNLLVSVRDLDTAVQQEMLMLCRDHFTEYWGQTLCNVLRAINHVMNASTTDELDFFD